MSWCKKCQSSFNGYPIERPGKVSRPERYAELKPGQLTSIARGLGASYGDAALNAHGEIILTHRLDRLLKFDTHQGLLSVEAGITLEKILKWSVKQGWFLPVIPGTAEVTLGGCIATDIHGKNHKDAGSLGQHILHLQLITASGKKINCSPQVMPELFWATIGGMGLTGIIGEATLQLKRIETAYMKVQVQAISRLKQIIEKLGQGENEFDYNVAWLDTLNKPFFHGLLIKAKHATLSELPDVQQKKPFVTSKYARLNCPSLFSYSVLHPRFVQWFNKAYYHLAKKNQFFLQAYHDYFFPLDRLKNWPRLYGKRGFIQYQCVIPTKFSYVAIHEIFEILQRNKQPIYLAVLKYFGQENLAPLSFPLPGFTLALDIPIRGDQLFECLNKLDEIVIQTGGRIYLAKDARLNPQAFRAMYKRYPEWLTVKQHWDPQDKMSSSLSRRLNLGF